MAENPLQSKDVAAAHDEVTREEVAQVVDADECMRSLQQARRVRFSK